MNIKAGLKCGVSRNHNDVCKKKRKEREEKKGKEKNTGTDCMTVTVIDGDCQKYPERRDHKVKRGNTMDAITQLDAKH